MARKKGIPMNSDNDSSKIDVVVPEETITTGVVKALEINEKPDKKKIFKKIAKYLLTTFLGLLIPFICKAGYDHFFNHKTEVESVKMELVGDANVLSETNMTSMKTFTINGDETEISLGYNPDDTWNCYAPRLKMKIEYKGTIDAIYVFYHDDMYDEFIMQKATGSIYRFFNSGETEYASEIVLNYTLTGGVENERVYIMIVDSDNTPIIYCARVGRYDPLAIPLDTGIDVKSSDEIYSLTPNRELNYWSLNKMTIIKEISDILKKQSNVISPKLDS